MSLDRYSLVRDFYLQRRDPRAQDENAGQVEDFDN